VFNNYQLVTSIGGSPLVADGNSVAFVSRGGNNILAAWGTFGGGTVKLQWNSDGAGTWIDYTPQNGVALTLLANGTLAFRLMPGQFRVALTGSAGPSVNYLVATADGE
jgi:hypothetical protein